MTLKCEQHWYKLNFPWTLLAGVVHCDCVNLNKSHSLILLYLFSRTFAITIPYDVSSSVLWGTEKGRFQMGESKHLPEGVDV